LLDKIGPFCSDKVSTLDRRIELRVQSWKFQGASQLVWNWHALPAQQPCNGADQGFSVGTVSACVFQLWTCNLRL